MKIKNALTTILISVLFVSNVAEASSEKNPTLHLLFHGSSPFSFVDERLTIEPNGSSTLESISSFPKSNEQNVIGKYTLQIDAKIHDQLLKEAKNIFRNPPKSLIPAHDAIIGEIYFGNGDQRSRYGWSFAGNKQAAIFEKLYGEIKSGLPKTPLKGLKLDCTRAKGDVHCDFVNVGTEAIKLVDPAGVPGSIRCFDAKNHRKILNGIEGIDDEDSVKFDPRSWKPRTISLKANERFTFKIPNSSNCASYVNVKTTDLLINPIYKSSVLLGDLNSNRL